MDLILGSFADRWLASMDEPGLAAFEALLDEPDPVLFAWIVDERAPVADRHRSLIEQLRRHRVGVTGSEPGP